MEARCYNAGKRVRVTWRGITNLSKHVGALLVLYLGSLYRAWGSKISLQSTSVPRANNHSNTIITVRRPHRQRMSSAANALLCNIGEGKQCTLLSYFSALQHLCGTRSCGKRARKGHFHGHEHTCTHTGRQRAQPPTLARPESKPAISLTFCAV